MRDRLAAKGITDVTLQPGKSGQFDIVIDGALKYSRFASHGFPTDAEVDALAD